MRQQRTCPSQLLYYVILIDQVAQAPQHQLSDSTLNEFLQQLQRSRSLQQSPYVTTTTSAPPFFSIHSILFPLDAGHSPCRASQWSAGSHIVLRGPSSSCQSAISRTKDLELQHNFYLTKIGKTSWIFFMVQIPR